MSEEAKTEDAAAADAHAEGHGEGHAHVHKGPAYITIFWYLLFLTVAEVLVALELVRDIIGYPLMATSLVLMAVTKATLVALYFMHVSLDHRRLRIIVLSPIFLSGLLFIAPIMEVLMAR